MRAEMGGGGKAEVKRGGLRAEWPRSSTAAGERTSTAGGGGGHNGGGGRRRSVVAVGELRRPTQPTTLPKKGRSMAMTVVRQMNSEHEGPHAELLGDDGQPPNLVEVRDLREDDLHDAKEDHVVCLLQPAALVHRFSTGLQLMVAVLHDPTVITHKSGAAVFGKKFGTKLGLERSVDPFEVLEAFESLRLIGCQSDVVELHLLTNRWLWDAQFFPDLPIQSMSEGFM
ncbi:hypothetical protein OsJ_27788 [Oryza sativa Japonica Group]|uniref:Uncharacterized protein n=1 Tax=Oryza sativa subsp. japonica TaxID=39947 RepID=B9G1K7_ORYSJ|nr:hypothetical protein OsJ_27788 [Oryza sativa Japonica Group]